MYTTQVQTAALPVSRWLAEYCDPRRFRDACRACPDYGNIWSCPPGVPDAAQAFAPFRTVHIIGVRVNYAPETLARARTPELTEQLRQASYGAVKKLLLSTLLELERAVPGSWTAAAGRCEQCARCARRDGLPCARPERMRYSLSAFGFDLGRIARELLGMELLWTQTGLPAYNVAIAAFLTP